MKDKKKGKIRWQHVGTVYKFKRLENGKHFTALGREFTVSDERVEFTHNGSKHSVSVGAVFSTKGSRVKRGDLFFSWRSGIDGTKVLIIEEGEEWVSLFYKPLSEENPLRKQGFSGGEKECQKASEEKGETQGGSH